MKVSDFKLAEHFLKAVCKQHKAPFADADVEFNKSSNDAHISGRYQDGSIHIQGSRSLSQTLLAIIGQYILNLGQITGSQSTVSHADQVEIYKLATAIIRDFTYAKGGAPQFNPDTPLLMGLRQFPFVWLLLRDVIAPLYQIELKDFNVLAARSEQMDAAKYVTLEEGKGFDEEKLPLIFLNLEVEPNTFRSAYMLVEAVKAHGLSPTVVVADLLGCPDIKSKTYGFSKLAFVVEDDVNDFLLTLASVANFHDLDILTKDRTSSVWYKQAQNVGPGGWLMPEGLEGMLGTVRITPAPKAPVLGDYITDLWRRVAEEKERRGKEDMNLEDLLRVQSQGQKVEPGVILQKLLSEDRVW